MVVDAGDSAVFEATGSVVDGAGGSAVFEAASSVIDDTGGSAVFEAASSVVDDTGGSAVFEAASSVVDDTGGSAVFASFESDDAAVSSSPCVEEFSDVPVGACCVVGGAVLDVGSVSDPSSSLSFWLRLVSA